MMMAHVFKHLQKYYVIKIDALTFLDNLPNLERAKKDLHMKWKEKVRNLERREEPDNTNEGGNQNLNEIIASLASKDTKL
jgi:hypothetical protein